jgi:hypothetical protein
LESFHAMPVACVVQCGIVSLVQSAKAIIRLFITVSESYFRLLQSVKDITVSESYFRLLQSVKDIMSLVLSNVVSFH